MSTSPTQIRKKNRKVPFLGGVEDGKVKTMWEPLLEHILVPVTVGDKTETKSYWLGYIDDIPFYISESLNWKEALLKRQELFGCGVRQSVKLWLAKDLDDYYGAYPCNVFRHEPALSESGKWWCHETDELAGGRVPSMDLFDLKPGEKMQILIQPNVSNGQQPQEPNQ